jgi:hypothetical protein
MIEVAHGRKAPRRDTLRKTFCLILAISLALPALAQDAEPAPVNPVTMGKGPKDGERVPAWIFYWLLGGSTVVCGGLLLGLRTLWGTLQDERKARDAPGLTTEEHAMLKGIHEMVTVKGPDDVPRIYSPRALPEAIARLTELAQETIEKLEKLGDARVDRQDMRASFETEKSQMRDLYTAEIKGLQTQLHQEQMERREETQQLWKKNDATTREVMTVIRDMIVALENASKVIDKWNESEE